MKFRMPGTYLYYILLSSFLAIVSQVYSMPARDSLNLPALKLVADYVRPGMDNTALLLEEVRYHSASYDETLWKKIPAVRKVAIACQAAEQRGNGKKFLSELIRRISKDNEGILLEPSLRPFLPESARRRKIRFGRVYSKSFSIGSISGEARKAILTIVKYTDRGALGGIQCVLRNYFHASDEKIFETLCNAEDNFQAFLEMSNDKTLQRSFSMTLASGIVNDLEHLYVSAASNEDFKKVYVSHEKIRPPAGPSRLANPSLVKLSSKKYKAYLDHFVSKPSFSFDKMINDSERWGGIVLGSKVTADSSVKGFPQHIVWLPNDKRKQELATGSLELWLPGCAEPLTTTTVFAEDVYAAYSMLYGSDTLIPHVNPGEGAGLVNAVHQFLSPEYTITLHPAIANLQLGRALARCDVWPALETKLAPLLDSLIEPGQKSILDSLIMLGHIRGWKFHDVPMQVRSNHGILEVAARTDISSQYPLTFVYVKNNWRVFTPFRAIVPVLCTALYDYYRLSQFAKTFALLRWAKENGADFVNAPFSLTMEPLPNFATVDYTENTVQLR